ncbi:MAG: hypothetical protein RBQ99_01685 [Trichlorobacter sp.]|nr:hypothetical protein [Trichlorobacter sp.]
MNLKKTEILMGVRLKMDCIVMDVKGNGMIRYKGRNYCLMSTVEDAYHHIEYNFPYSMHADFEVIAWQALGGMSHEN